MLRGHWIVTMRMNISAFTSLILVVSVPLTVPGCEREKDRLDAEVRRLCAQDGGIRVYETVTLPPDRFDKFGVVHVPLRSSAKSSDEFTYEWDITYFRKGSPEMWKNHFRLVRMNDGKLIGEAISYSRRGGDFPGPWHDSSYGCPADGDISGLKQHVFLSVEGEGRK